MIILDTDVLSALMANAPDRAVVQWLDRQPADSVWITTVTLFEVHYGIAKLPAGRRRRELQSSIETMVADYLENRILDFDGAAAREAAALAAARDRKGRPVDARDTFIAGIALARRATLATGNVRHFGELAVPVIDPWHP
ncbi:MAG TPA: type II toxin-antitoxin system VapC family toxin [Burkholderiales bacterium]|nr:type II toxin-antitoxin system VapC family toxin [Burkholderiales bacterium]